MENWSVEMLNTVRWRNGSRTSRKRQPFTPAMVEGLRD
jgi:hypothetical protein